MNFILLCWGIITASLGSNYSNQASQKDLTNADLTHNHSANLNNLSIAHYSVVSWGAILASTTASSALSLILIILGFGLGMSSISVWSGQGISTEALGITTILWIAFTQIIAYGMGGYLAGRLRTK